MDRSTPARPVRTGPLLAAFVLLAVPAAPGCGAGAGSTCESNDDCAAGLSCRGGVCLPSAMEDADAGPPDVPEDDGARDDGARDRPEDAAEAEVEAADESEAEADGEEDAGEEDVEPPPLGTLEPGETYDPPSTEASGVLGAAGETYVLVLWENGLGIWDRFDVTLEIENGRKAGDGRVKLDEPVGRAAVPCLPGRFEDPTAIPLPRAPIRIPVLRDPLPGDTTTFKVIDATGTSVSEVTAHLEYIGPALEIWADDTNPFDDPGDEVYQGIAERYQSIILPRERALFHDEPDVDANGHVTVLVSPTVGEMGASGYVNPLDLTTSAYGNHKDMIYLNPPWARHGADYAILSSVGVLAHESQHLIRAGALGDAINESIYFNEGMSHLAADLAGYGFDNLWFLSEFLSDPNLFTVPRGIDSARMAASTDYRQDIVMRSAGYFLLLYLFDRLGGVSYAPDGTIADSGGLSFLRSQYVDTLRGIAELEWTTGASRRDFIPDWLTAMLLDGRTDRAGTPLDLPPRYRFGDPSTDPLTSAQHGVALNAENNYLDWGTVFLANVSPTDLRDFVGTIDGGGIGLVMVRPVVSGPVVARVTVESDGDLGVRWVRLD